MKLSELCTIISKHGIPAALEGEDADIRAVAGLEDAKPGEISFLSNPKYASALATTRATAVAVGEDVEVPPGIAAIRAADPYAAITIAMIAIHGHREHPRLVDRTGHVSPSANIGESANIAPGATIADDVVIGDRCTIYPGCYVADGARLGDDCTLFPNVCIYERCEIGHRVTIHAGTVVGQDGLGYAPFEGKWIKIPQLGRVFIGDDVELGANCAIDRATLGATVIGRGTKFGNEIVIGHGSKIGEDCLFVGQVGIAGSVTIGNRVTLAGQVGTAGHITIGDDVRVAGQSGINHDIPPKTDVIGSPAIPHELGRRAYSCIKKLPEWGKKLRSLEKQITKMREGTTGETPD